MQLPVDIMVDMYRSSTIAGGQQERLLSSVREARLDIRELALDIGASTRVGCEEIIQSAFKSGIAFPFVHKNRL